MFCYSVEILRGKQTTTVISTAHDLFESCSTEFSALFDRLFRPLRLRRPTRRNRAARAAQGRPLKCGFRLLGSEKGV